MEMSMYSHCSCYIMCHTDWYWLAGTDTGHEGCWVWASYPQVMSTVCVACVFCTWWTDYTRLHWYSALQVQKFVYTHWRSGEPTGMNGYNCLYMYHGSSHWGDWTCSHSRRYICKKTIGVPVTSMASHTDLSVCWLCWYQCYHTMSL